MGESRLQADYDLCIIGGGINGAGIARDAAGRGLKVLLVEARDLASATSSASTKLIHGGLRYLEHNEFKLVRESLQERERLLNMAPHIIWPLEFILPHDSGQRPLWLIRLGLFLYDHLAERKKLPGSCGIKFAKTEHGLLLKDEFKQGFSYYDCWVEDSRLVVLNAVSAAQKGAQIKTYTNAEKIEHHGDFWRVHLQEALTQKAYSITARMIVNAAGPWVREILQNSKLIAPKTPNVRLVKGSHIIIPRAHEGQHAYILQQPDQRIVFVIPYEGQYTLIGTTEESFEGNAYEAAISEHEIKYLCSAYNRAFKTKIGADHVIWTYSGVRPLFEDGDENTSAVTRDFFLYESPNISAPMVSVFGGKLTTYRVVAEQVMQKVLSALQIQNKKNKFKSWTALEFLPGGDMPHGNFDIFLEAQSARYPWINKVLLERYARAYGTRMDVFLTDAVSYDDLGVDCGEGVYEAEIRYLTEHEWARTSADILWRRTKLGLHVSESTIDNLENLLATIFKNGP